MDEDELPALVRRIRRCGDLSQRELAALCGTSQSAVARAETGRGDLPARLVLRAARLTGLRLALLDAAGTEVPGMAPGAVRDGAGRRFPAHLDTRHGDQDWWHGDERYSREQPWYTYDRVREWRDDRRERLGTPDDHQLPRPDDSPRDREAARRHAARLRRAEEARRRREARGWVADPGWTCECPPGCDATREVTREVHAEDCPCRCDIA